MLKKRSPIFQKVFNLKKVSILIAKLRKPLMRKLIILKKGRKLEVARHYNYGYIQEYEYSPSITRSHVQFGMMRPTFKNRKLLNKLHHSLLYLLNCVCMLEDENKIQSELIMKSGNSMEETKMVELTEIGGGEDVAEEEDDDWSVDERAEMFIQSFYQEIRRQRNETLMLQPY